MIVEKWKEVTGFTDYEVSDLGRVRRLTFGSNSSPVGTVLKPSTDVHGYKRVCLYPKTRQGRNGHNKLVHRLVAIAFIPNPNNLPEVNHKSSTRNNRATKLEWRSKGGNMQHAVQTEKFGKYAGVYLEKRRNHWVARYWQGKHVYVGSYPNKHAALRARRAAVKNLKEVV